MELNDLWSVKFSALWDPSKVKPIQNTVQESSHQLHNMGQYDGRDFLDIIVPDIQEFAEGIAPHSLHQEEGMTLSDIFSPHLRDSETNWKPSVGRVRDWMKENSINWIGMRNEIHGKTFIYPADNDLSRDDLRDILRLNTSNSIVVYPDKVSDFLIYPSSLACSSNNIAEHERHECDECVDSFFDVYHGAMGS